MLMGFTASYLNKSIEIFMGIFTDDPWNYDWISADKVHDYFMDLINTPNSKSYVYFMNGRLCGVCFGKITLCSVVPIYEICEIFVPRDLQSKGVGTKMLRLIEQDLRENDIAAVKLCTMRDIPAFDYYMKNGYEVIDAAVSLSKVL